jgi:hypothetical protein
MKILCAASDPLQFFFTQSIMVVDEFGCKAAHGAHFASLSGFAVIYRKRVGGCN